ncbi:MAG: nuclear transport factor 2 family protein [Microbacteriaceae bacterium]|nr:nuclear transport factor 2 family protein [Microbacteriaceae bacterium]
MKTEITMTDTTTSTDTSIHEKLDKLQALEDIRVLKGRYWRYVDTKQWAAFEKLWAPDSSFSDRSANFSCSTPAGIVEAISGALETVTSIHQGTPSELEILGPDTARGIWSMTDVLFYPSPSPETQPNAGITIRGYGHYVEQYVKIDGRWVFKKSDLYRLRLERTEATNTEYPPDFSV